MTGLLFAGVDPSEEFPGGSGSTDDFSVQAFSHPLSGTRGQLRRDFNVGNSFFNTVWVESPSATTLRDGLGPIYNAVSCSSCHFKDGRGRGLPEAPGKVDVSLLFRLRVKNGPKEVIPHPVYGSQFQPVGVSGVRGEGSVHVSFEEVEGSLQKPVYQFLNLNYGPLGEATIASPRVAPQMIGLGFVEAINESDILKNEDPYDLDGDGISGRACYVYSEEFNSQRLGRFGWKAGKPTLKEQNAAAFNGDIGITTPLFPTEECTSSQADCQSKMTSEDLSLERLDLVTTYTQLLAPPKRRNFESKNVKKGQEVFKTIGCGSCHSPSFTTGSDHPIEQLRNEKIYPYSDFLVHDMGPGLADDKDVYANEETVTTHEWRTPPLWGLGLTQTVNGHTRYLHDGRARNLSEAILWHGGEGHKAKEAFQALSNSERQDLIEFLNSL